MELIKNKKGNDKESIKIMEKRFPFFAWECISLEFKDKNIDIVIRNE